MVAEDKKRAKRLRDLLEEILGMMDQLTERIVEARELAPTSNLFGSDYDTLKEVVNTARMDLWFIGVCIESEEYLENIPETYISRLGDEYKELKNRMRDGKLE
jgi:Asp-tRNA(Asn)/Glu-tRNA(Gln) amidotransferase C subunit